MLSLFYQVEHVPIQGPAQYKALGSSPKILGI
jgi:hypothetical protein